MRNAVLWSLAGLLAVASGAKAAEPELKTEEQKTFYAIGLALSQSLAAFGLSPAELELVKAGLTDGVLNKDKKGVDLQVYGPKIQELQTARERHRGGRREEGGAGVPRQGGGREGRDQDLDGPRDDDDQAGHWSVAQGDGQGEGALPGHAHRRDRLRQLAAAQ